MEWTGSEQNPTDRAYLDLVRGARRRISGGAGERRVERKRRGRRGWGRRFGAMSGLNWFESTGRRGLYKA